MMKGRATAAQLFQLESPNILAIMSAAEQHSSPRFES